MTRTRSLGLFGLTYSRPPPLSDGLSIQLSGMPSGFGKPDAKFQPLPAGQSFAAAVNAVARLGRNSHSEAKADRLRPTVSRTAKIPTRSSSKPNRNGAAATERRAGTATNPVRRPYTPRAKSA